MNAIKILFCLCTLMIISCVQPYYNRTVNFRLDVSGVKDSVVSVGVRGKEKPLSWSEDFPMKEIYKDSIYEAAVTYQTGYLFTEVKFVVNGNFELQDKDNRRVRFDVNSNTTNYAAKFDVR
jgi:hypothetical protein